MADRDLIIQLYEGYIGVHQFYYLNRLAEDGYNVWEYTQRRFDDLGSAMRLEEAIRAGNDAEAKKIYENAANLYEKYVYVNLLSMCEEAGDFNDF